MKERGGKEDISLTPSQGFLSHIFLHASAVKKVMHVAGFKAAFIGGFAILGFVLVVRCNNSITCCYMMFTTMNNTIIKTKILLMNLLALKFGPENY